MRLSVGMESTLRAPSEEEKGWYKEDAEDIFVLRDNSKIVAVARLDGDEIDSVGVDVNHLKHKGLTDLVHFLCAKINISNNLENSPSPSWIEKNMLNNDIFISINVNNILKNDKCCDML